MRVKIGNTWYEVTKETPIMIEVSEIEKRQIGEMTGTKYAQFHDDTPLADSSDKYDWMEVECLA